MKKMALLSFLLIAAHAFSQNDSVSVRDAIENWLRAQTRGQHGETSFEIVNPEASQRLAACRNLDVSRPGNEPLWGRINVLVRCQENGNLRAYIPVLIRIKADYLVTARPIAHGQIIADDDLTVQTGDLPDLPGRLMTDRSLVVGKSASSPIPAGRPLRPDMLRAATVIRSGQTVRVLSRGPGFEVANEGRALSNAAEGQLAQIRLSNGQVVSGIARSGGIVEISY